MRILTFFSVILLSSAFQPQPFIRKLKQPTCTRNILLSAENDNENNNRFDPIEAVGGFFGYPPEYKWKGVRIACYSIGVGFLVGDLINEIQHPDSQFLAEFMNNPIS